MCTSNPRSKNRYYHSPIDVGQKYDPVFNGKKITVLSINTVTNRSINLNNVYSQKMDVIYIGYMPSDFFFKLK